MNLLRLRHLMPALGLAVLLAGCASTPPQATVQVFTSQPPAAGATYRYDRLPSQAGQPGQVQLEATADTLLARAGLRRDDAAGRLSVQLAAVQDGAYGGYGGGPVFGGSSVGVGIGGGGRGGGIGIGLGFPLGGGAVQGGAQRVDVVLRDLPTGQVLFQSQASGSAGVSASALLEAALRDFPNAPTGTRQLPLAAAAPR